MINVWYWWFRQRKCEHMRFAVVDGDVMCLACGTRRTGWRSSWWARSWAG